MEEHCRGGTIIDSVTRLGNQLSDDSLLLDDGNTSSMWADSQNQSARSHVLDDFLPSNSFASVLLPDNELRSVRNVWDMEDLTTDSLSNPTFSRNANGVFNVSGQPRLSFSTEDAEMPLLGDHNSEDLSDAVKHCHSEILNHSNQTAWRRLLSTTLMCVFFMIAEVVGGHFAGSLAIMTDAAHLLSDLVGLLVSLSAVWLGQRAPTKVLTFGFHRAEVLGALFSIFVIWVLTGIFVYLAALRLVHGDFVIHADRMMAVAAGGIVINIVMAVVLHGGCQHMKVPHSHGFTHHQHLVEPSLDSDSERRRFSIQSDEHQPCNSDLRRIGPSSLNDGSQSLPRKQSNINVRAAAVHVLGDLVQSIGVFVSAVVIKFNPNAKMADPICTFLFAVIVLFTTLPLLRDTSMILLEGFPRNFQYSQVLALLRSLPGVLHVHSLHIWSLTAGKHAMAVHLAVDSATDRDAVTHSVQCVFARKFGIQHFTIQTERYNPTAMHTCLQCQPLMS